MENKQSPLYPDYGDPDYDKNDPEADGCVYMLFALAAGAASAIAWGFYELLTFN